MQQYADIYLLQNHSTCFGCHSTHHQEHLKTATAASGTGRNIGTATSLQLAKSLYMFRVSQHPSSGALKTATAASGTGHNIGTATSLQRGPISGHVRGK